MSRFHRLEEDGNSFNIIRKRVFTPNTEIKNDDIKQTFEFAYGMTFGKEGEHRNHRTGGQLRRKPGEIFTDTFQGKLSEFAFFNYLKDNLVNPDLEAPDLNMWSLNKWDSSDFIVDGHEISVKSTKEYGNLLLLETKDWDEDARYIPNFNTDHCLYDFFVIVRISPDLTTIMKQNRILYSNSVDKNRLESLIMKSDWKCNLAGFITRSELKELINSKYILPQNSLLNGRTRMDAENYYAQMGDMHNIDEIIDILNK